MTPAPEAPGGPPPEDEGVSRSDQPDPPGPDLDARALAGPGTPPAQPAARRAGSAAQKVAAGILLSRISGLLRDAIFARVFGLGIQADAFRAALKMPNVLQNLLGEGTLSASFIPVYSELHHQGREEEAGRVAGAVFALLLALAGFLSLFGMLLAPVLVSVFTPGFQGEQRALAITAARIIFPMTGVLVLSAWALGVLNSHRRFLLPYMAPVAWNAAMIATLLFFFRRMNLSDLTVALAWGALVGGILQFAVQLPGVLKVERNLKIRWDLQLEGVRTTIRNATPAIIGRGVVQLSGYFDLFLASFLGAGGVAGVTYAQTLYLLPVSLFGMSIAAAELPELARERGAGAAVLRERVRRGVAQTALFIIPTIVGYILIGRPIVAALYQGVKFTADDTAFVHLLLAVYALGLFASTSTRLYSSAFYALHQTRTTARVAIARVLVSGSFGALFMLALKGELWRERPLGAVGLAIGASLGAWLEWFWLRKLLSRRVGGVGVPARTLAGMLGAALAGSGAAYATLLLLPGLHPSIAGALALAVFGAAYFPVAALLGVREARPVLERITRRLRRG